MRGFFKGKIKNNIKDNIEKFQSATGIGPDEIDRIFAGLQFGGEEKKTNLPFGVTFFTPPDLSNQPSIEESINSTSNDATSKALVECARGIAAKLEGLSYNSVYCTGRFYEYDQERHQSFVQSEEIWKMALSDDDCLKEEFNNFKDVINFLIEKVGTDPVIFVEKIAPEEAAIVKKALEKYEELAAEYAKKHIKRVNEVRFELATSPIVKDFERLRHLLQDHHSSVIAPLLKSVLGKTGGSTEAGIINIITAYSSSL
ncbi:hypothetical protein [Coxiella burnetii]|uniref:hypothetical protein n=1 Tax=Coxiella burnetii TaxID=777 RepID=UPI0002D5D718|nr:hypothetical protein [Coxiella burnetii]